MTERRSVPAWGVGAVAALLALPLVVAVVQLRSPQWHPVLDLAMTELRVRDVGTRDTPLIGLPGRIGETLEEQGSHPGPASFYALAPTYRVLGSTSWALQVGSALIHAVAIGVALALARRRGGAVLFSAVAVLLAVLVSGLGTGALTEPWNPYLPLMWWVVLLVSVWSVLAGDVVALPVAAVAGSFGAQTHVPYLSLSVGLGVAAAVWAVILARRADGPADRRTAVWSVVAAVAAGVLLWLPPTVDQLTEDPGNYAKLVDHFTTPPEGEEPIGFAEGTEQALQRLDPWHLASHAVGRPALLTNGSAERFPSEARGAALALVWLVSGVAAVAVPRLRERRLLALHATVAGALVLGTFSITRIFGLTWYYLMLWMWAVGGLALLAAAWTAGLAATRGRDLPSLSGRAPAFALAALAALVTAHTTAADGLDPVRSDEEVSDVLGALVPDTIAALERSEGAATGREGRYHVTWQDAFHIGSQAFGLVSELERAGFTAGLGPPFRVPITATRFIPAADATAQVVLATGDFVDDVRSQPGAVEVAFVDPRSADDLVRYDELRERAASELDRAGLDDVTAIIETNLFGAAVDDRVPDVTRRLLDEMLAIGTPTAVFVLPAPAP